MNVLKMTFIYAWVFCLHVCSSRGYRSTPSPGNASDVYLELQVAGSQVDIGNLTQVLWKSSRHFNCWVISSPSNGTPGPISDMIMTVHRMWKDVLWQKTEENEAFPTYNCMLQQLTSTSKRQYLLSCALYPNSTKFSLFYLLAYRKHSASFFFLIGWFNAQH